MEHLDEVPKEIMNPTNQPVSFYGDNSRNTDSALLAAMATKDYFNPVDEVAASGICDLRAEVSNNRWFVKDAEAQIRRDIAKSEADIRAEVIKEGQEGVSATKDAECRLGKEIMETKFAVTKEVLETKHSLAKDILKSEYENKLALQTAIKEIKENAQHNAERTQDFVNHGFEEVNEKLCECCEEQAVATANTQNGLVNIQNLLSQLVSGGPGNS